MLLSSRLPPACTAALIVCCSHKLHGSQRTDLEDDGISGPGTGSGRRCGVLSQRRHWPGTAGDWLRHSWRSANADKLAQRDEPCPQS